MLGKTTKTGSKVRFYRINEFSQQQSFLFSQIAERAQEDAFLLEGLRLIVRDEREGKEREEIYHYEEGLVAFLNYLHEDKEVFHKPISFSGVQNGIKVDCAFQYADEYQENIFLLSTSCVPKMGEPMKRGLEMPLRKYSMILREEMVY